MLEKTIILDMRVPVLMFEKIIYPMDVHGEELCKEIIRFVLDYICELDFAEFTVGEYVSELKTTYENHLSPSELDEFERAVTILTTAVKDQCISFGAYDADRTLRYRFDCFIGNDIVLRRMTEQEIVDGIV
jgi:hypothetical protein